MYRTLCELTSESFQGSRGMDIAAECSMQIFRSIQVISASWRVWSPGYKLICGIQRALGRAFLGISVLVELDRFGILAYLIYFIFPKVSSDTRPTQTYLMKLIGFSQIYIPSRCIDINYLISHTAPTQTKGVIKQVAESHQDTASPLKQRKTLSSSAAI